MPAQNSREAVDRLIAFATEMYELSPEQVDELQRDLAAKFLICEPARNPVAELDLLRAEVAELKAMVGILAARPICPHGPKA